MNKETLFSNTETANSKQLEILQKHFPQCFDKQGNFIQEKLLEVVKSSDVELSKESYSLNWLGKSYARLLTNLPPKTLLNEDKEHNHLEANKDSQNLLIKGDNLEVLKHMVNAYSEKVKMIYIDPPYNTGSDGFVYNDDRKFTPQQLSELAGIDLDEATRILDFTAKGSSSHSAWLTFMYPRLYIARELLREDGVIFISIDDNEVNQLKLVCDEIFGESNSLGTIIHNKLNSKSDTLNIQKNHDYLLCYRKSSVNEVSLVNDEPVEKEVYKDGNRFYLLNDPITTRGEGGTLNKRKNLGYTVYYNPISGDFIGVSDYDLELALTSNKEDEVYTDDKELIAGGYIKIRPPKVRGKLGVWTWDINKFNSEKDNILIKKTKNGYTVRKRTFVNADDVISKDGKYFITANKASNTRSILEFSTNEGTTQLLETIGKADIFSNPKNINLLKYVFGLIQGSDFIALDFFAGSGSSLQALQQLNVEDSGSRKFIAVQLEERCKEDSSAKEAGYETIFEITKDRLLKASEKIRAENPDYQGDLGFKIFETVEDFRVKDEGELTLENHSFFDDAVLTDKQYNTLLTTWCVYDGSLLTTPIQDVDLNGYTAHLCDKRLYLIAPNFNSETIKALLHELDNNKDFEPNKVVFYGNNFDSAKQMELNEALKGYANKKSLEIDLVVRN
ncbi:site-specific DNA-methyltransferase [Vibrio parahaemolyticus]|uniref:site-specific DNA-methyltransferase n=1 Tax=Vibrio parahaemolyticus TaxID=670 RepID=UPI001D6E3ABC|nr:site-specific DNA-methyltransferase [Vibrio parahaemolyticus]EJG1955207.1 site-specific DNA-methyltransferase [Vibrio parahaemolyticus]MCF9521486.1 site-specific DNA-methyltransferase [Vibrio parahaemolyticus]MCF9565397.1 site-specific DNA-methyltransferase [Vibrio parahaemolyticus]MCF9597458.1 site-specific DNA-methyltransferase [Vibrio parahaemolyticus]